ncbi:MAG: hypothetical protein JRG91_11410, partial [Deltaproteobacteria bacterium]|nr:hypothetical protein [Deltaproteobacteria bacterium]
GLTLVSTLTLTYEVIQIRIFSYALQPVVAFMAIAIAMLGFGAGATLLTLRPDISRTGTHRRLSILSLCLAASILLVNVFFAHTSSRVMEPGVVNISPLWVGFVLLPCVLPYFLAGLITAVILERGVERIGTLYFWNLLGSAAGCVLAIVLLRPLGAEIIVGLAATGATVAGLVFAWPEGGRLRWIAAGAVAGSLVLVPFSPRLLLFQPDTNEAVMKLTQWDLAEGRPGPVREFTQWDPVGRIDVIKHGRKHIFVSEPTEFRTVTIDGGAMTLVVKDPRKPGWGKALFEQSTYGAAYHLRKNPDVLVIGVGGGSDINTALYWNAKSVTGAEISLSTLRALTGPYAAFAGWPERTDVVEVIHIDGRAIAKSTDRTFDIIQMSGVDTFTMHSAGSMVLAEDYLYTTDAFGDFISLLEPDGILQVIRFGDEALSLSAIAAGALRSRGIEHPERHIVALQQNWLSGILVKREPFTAGEIETLRRMEDRKLPTGVVIPHYDEAGIKLSAPIKILHPGGKKQSRRDSDFFDAMAQGRESEALMKLKLPFIVPTDDRPYYMLGSWMSLLQRKLARNPLIDLIITSTLVTASAALLLILLPVAWVRRKSDASAGTMAGVVLYFFSLGACFMLFEVGLIHRTIVFVGTPGASVSVVLASILVSSGIGARVTDIVRWSAARKIGAALAGLLAVGLFHAFFAGALFEPLYGLPVWQRSIVAALALAPVGFFMGWFFPLGLGITASRAASLVPWAIAVNGFASVIGSLATLPLSLAFGFRTLFVLAALGYVVAVAVMMPMALSASKRSGD